MDEQPNKNDGAAGTLIGVGLLGAALYAIYWFFTRPTTPGCQTHQTQTECESNGCTWYNNSCNPTLVCSEINTEVECFLKECYWYEGSCHSSPPPIDCASLPEATCELNGCFWYNDSCHQSLVCSEINNMPDCISHLCFWYDGSCHSLPGPGQSVSDNLSARFKTSNLMAVKTAKLDLVTRYGHSDAMIISTAMVPITTRLNISGIMVTETELIPITTRYNYSDSMATGIAGPSQLTSRYEIVLA